MPSKMAISLEQQTDLKKTLLESQESGEVKVVEKNTFTLSGLCCTASGIS
jgi:hypothetical protein